MVLYRIFDDNPLSGRSGGVEGPARPPHQTKTIVQDLILGSFGEASALQESSRLAHRGYAKALPPRPHSENTMSKTITIHDIARAAGVSSSTVSRVLSGNVPVA